MSILRYKNSSAPRTYFSHASELTRASPLWFLAPTWFAPAAALPNKISMALSRPAGDDAQPHWLIALRRGRGRIGLIRREVATAQSALSKLSIVGGSLPAALSALAAHLRGRPTESG